MPSKNSINRPKDNINRSKKAARLSRKRGYNRTSTSQVTSIPVSRPSGEFKKSTDFDSTLLKSTALALYTGRVKPVNSKITVCTLSNKRAKKIERNKKYAAARSTVKKELKKSQGDVDMDLDQDIADAEEAQKVRDCLWSVVEDAAAGNYHSNLVLGEGTTLGGPFF